MVVMTKRGQEKTKRAELARRQIMQLRHPEIPDLLTWPVRIAKDRLIACGRLESDPIPGERARIRRQGKAYYSERYTTYRDAVGFAMQQAIREQSLIHELDPEQLFGVRVVFSRATRQRTDVDNMLKSVLDAGTGVVWPDDCQVAEAIVRNFGVNRQAPFLEFAMYRLDAFVNAGPTCLHCGKTMKDWYPSVPRRTCAGFCTKAYKKAHPGYLVLREPAR